MTIFSARQKGIHLLQKNPQLFKTPQLDVDCIMSFILKKPKSFLFTHSDTILSWQKKILFFYYMYKRKSGLPIAYITQQKEFFSFPFYVNKSVLIPKPDSELIVQKSIDYIRATLKTTNTVFFADICVGSGCLALSILKTLQNPRIFCDTVDISQSALKVAKKNTNLLLDKAYHKNIRFFKGDLTTPLKNNCYDLILSNPPYVPTDMVTKLLKDGRKEPRLALDGGKNGLQLINPLIQGAFLLLKKNGILLVEIGEYNAKQTVEIFKSQGFKNIRCYKDLTNAPRLIGGIK